MERPSRIRVNGQDWSVCWATREWMRSTDKWGESDATCSKIAVVYEGRAPHAILATFIHELTHAIHRTSALSRREKWEPEDLSTLMESAPPGFFRDNPYCVKWMLEMASATDHARVRRVCIHEECGWEGYESDCVTPKHDPSRVLCPQCYDTAEVILEVPV